MITSLQLLVLDIANLFHRAIWWRPTYLLVPGTYIAGLENRDYGRGDPLRWPRDTLYQLKLALTSSAGCGRSVGIVRLRTKTTEFSFSLGTYIVGWQPLGEIVSW
jgi:hypothetical protein